jgi:predicted DNA-binding ribbon-helix-helix protein
MDDEQARSAVIKRSVVIGGHKTSVSLEDRFWQGLREIAGQRGMTISALLDEIDGHRESANLSSHIRLYVFDHFRSH